jgi:hypothetical protein
MNTEDLKLLAKNLANPEGDKGIEQDDGYNQYP